MSDKRADKQRKRAKRKAKGSEPYRPPFRGLPGSTWEGMTNLEAARDQADAMGGPPERGSLYRLTFGQGSPPHPVSMVVEYAGMAEDRVSGQAEYAYRFIIRNPELPPDAKNGTADDPLVLWPLDVIHLSPAEPEDMDEVRVLIDRGERTPEGDKLMRPETPQRAD